jgi:predicted Zn-dependent peptidase
MLTFAPSFMKEDYQLFRLPNGIRVAFKPLSHSKVVHCGFILDIGSRDEGPGEEGLAHFWEHMVFKGTQKRNAFRIIDRLESVGGELNAYTTKEKICFYASVLQGYFPRAIELLTDITFHSTFPAKHLEMERGVILEEMALYEDSPEDHLQDKFDELLFAGHPLGNNILGNRERIASFKVEHLLKFVEQNVSTERIIFSVVGDIDAGKLRYYTQKYLGELPHREGKRYRKPFSGYRPVTMRVEKPISQTHCAIGGMAYPVNHPKQLPFFMLINLLGGPAMNSKLNLALRERNGLVYAIEAQYQPYSDTGALGIFFATDKPNTKKALRLVHKEMKSLREKPLGSMQLHRAKAQIKGQLAMAEENENAFMLSMGKSLLESARMPALDELFSKIDQISPKLLMDIANECLNPENLSTLIFDPED